MRRRGVVQSLKKMKRLQSFIFVNSELHSATLDYRLRVEVSVCICCSGCSRMCALGYFKTNVVHTYAAATYLLLETVETSERLVNIDSVTKNETQTNSVKRKKKLFFVHFIRCVLYYHRALRTIIIKK